MNVDLDPLLSAYLDGELDAAGRRRVEQATRSDPVVANRLAALARVRDLVATLSSPVLSEDVSGAVLLALARRHETRRTAWRRAGVVTAMVVPGLAAAAALLLMFGLGKQASALKMPPRQPQPLAKVLPSPPHPPRPVTAPRPTPALARVAVAIPPVLLTRETKARDDRETLTRMLGRDDVRFISVTVDTFGPSSLDDMDEAIRFSNFREPLHARVRIVQNIVIDPNRPGPGCAYALVMDESEHRLFRSNLDARFPDSVHESPAPSRETLARLSTAGHVEIFRGQARATLMDPPPDAADDIAVRHPREILQGQVVVDTNPRASKTSPMPLPRVVKSPMVVASGAPALPKPASPPAPARVPRGDSSSTLYVVWLSAREKPRL
ncbi:MAG: hypothetical protein JWN86_1531 [Planctomycetota bacterium]|nr:hypothetical protein [Planctomycetota bacterium]